MQHLKLLAVIAATLFSTNIYPESYYNFNWSEFTELPSSNDSCKQIGVSAPYAGVSNGAVIVAGGCNFPDAPVVDGGTKRFYDDIYVLPEGKEDWLTGYKLPTPAAYGASATTPKGAVFIGGSNSTGALSEAIIVNWDSTAMELIINPLPSLPYTITEFTATAVGNTVYVAGGKSSAREKNQLLSLNLNNLGKEEFKWEVESSFTGNERFQSALVALKNGDKHQLLLAGGYQFYADKNTPPTIATNALIYNIEDKTWHEIPIPSNHTNTQYTLTGATALTIGDTCAMFIGGVERTIFQDALTREHNNLNPSHPLNQTIFKAWKRGYLTQSPTEYQFNPHILIYNPKTNNWHIHQTPYPYPAPAGAATASTTINNTDTNSTTTHYIINGEIKPGIRSPKVYRCTIEE